MTLSPNQVTGLDFQMKVTNPLHISDQPNVKSESIEKSFLDVMKSAILDVNDMAMNADKLAQTMVSNPEAVNIHDVTIAMSKAEMGMMYFKAVTDKVVLAYREIINMR